MTAITLRSEDGKWTYQTTTDDPLFSTILTALRDIDKDLPSELVFTGVVGEILSRDWHRVENVLARMKCVESMGIDPLPSSFVLRRDMEQINGILDLPTGWEVHTVVDDKDSLPYRLTHLSMCHQRLREDRRLRYAVYTRMPPGARVLLTFSGRYLMKRIIRMVRREIYSPFNEPSTLTTPIAAHILNVLTQSARGYVTSIEMISKVNWNDVLALLPPIPGTKRNISRTLAEWMTGHSASPPALRIYSVPAYSDYPEFALAQLDVYSKCIRLYPSYTSPRTLGMGIILGYPEECPDFVNAVLLYQFVWRVHTRVLQRYITDDATLKQEWSDKNPSVLIPHYPHIVSLLANTVGLYSLRRILESLSVLREKDIPMEVLERAYVFSESVREYLEKHEGEDESPRTIEEYE